MSKRPDSSWLVPVLAGSLFALVGCGDDAVGATSDGSGSSGSTTQTSLTTLTTGSVDSTGIASESASGSESADSTGGSTETDGDTDGDTDTDTDTGGEVESGRTAHAFVNAGTISESPGYRLIWTFGQETQNQNTMDSPDYILRGGFIGSSQ